MNESIKSIKKEKYSGYVYNLEVEPNHPYKDDQYYIDSETGIVIHNCHPRDNIALRTLADRLGLKYDIFSTIMKAREVQSENISDVLVYQSKLYNLPIIILGGSYKPNVEYLDGSTSIMVAHYCEKNGCDVLIDPKYPTKGIYLLGHWGMHHDYPFPKGSIVVDPWREFTSDSIPVIQYGNTR